MATFPTACCLLGILFVSVLLHEIAHALAAVWVGGHADQIVLWPLGGLAPPQVPARAGAGNHRRRWPGRWSTC